MTRPQSLRMQWHITERCNWHCRHCYQGREYIKKELSLEDMLEIFKDFVRLGDKLSIPFPLLGIAFTGGEPFIRRDFEEFLEIISPYKNRLVFSLYTNGSFLSKKIVLKLRDEIGIRSVQLSVEGCEDTNDSVRTSGAYRLVKEKIGLLNELNINAQLSLTVLKTNISEIPSVIADFSDYRVRFNVRRFVPLGKGSEIKELMPSPREIKKLYETLESRKNSRLQINIMRGCEEGIFAALAPPRYTLDHCHLFDKSIIAVMPNGDVYPCRRFPVKIGNAVTENLSEIYLNSGIYKELNSRETNHKECSRCGVFDQCLGGSRCIAHAYFSNGSFRNPDPQCFKLFDELPKQSWVAG